MHPLRIGVDIRCLMEGSRTGIEEYTIHLLRAMLEAANDETFVLFANSRRPMRLPEFSGGRVEVRTYAYPNTAFNLSLKFFRAPRLDALADGVDVFFCPTFRLTPLSRRTPLVLTVHDVSFVRHPEFFSPARRLWHHLIEPASLVGRADRIIAVSRATAHDVGTLYGVPPERLTVIPSGLAPQMIRLQDDDAQLQAVRARYGLPGSFILFLGTLEPRKNLDGLLSAYAKVRASGLRHSLVLAGTRGWIDDRFFARLRAHAHAVDIIRTGFIEDADKPAVYQLADVFVYPSFYEGFGFPPLEALAVGTPVVTSYNSAIPEVAGAWATLVNPYDPEELADVLVDRLQHPVRVPEQVSMMVRAQHSWDHAARATLRVLHQAATGPSRVR